MEELTRHLTVVERQHLGADDLVRLMALARDDDRVTGAGPAERVGDGRAPVGLARVATLASTAPHALHDLVDDRVRALRARIVRRDPHTIGQARGDLAHDRSLAAIAIAAAAEDDGEAALRELARGGQHALERVRGM